MLRKEFDKLLEWTAGEPAPDIVNLTNSMLIALARPLARSARAAGLLHASGRGAVSRRADRTVPDPRARAHPPAGAGTSIGSSRSATTTRGFMARLPARFLRERISVVPLGINTTGFEPRATSRPTACSASATSRGSRRRKACTCSPTPSAAFGTRGPEARVRLEVAGYLAPPAQAVSRRCRADRSSAPGSPATSRYHGAVDRDGKLAFLRRPRRALGAGDLRRAEGHFPARGDGERRARRAAAARRVHRDRRANGRRPPRRARRRREPG